LQLGEDVGLDGILEQKKCHGLYANANADTYILVKFLTPAGTSACGCLVKVGNECQHTHKERAETVVVFGAGSGEIGGIRAVHVPTSTTTMPPDERGEGLALAI
jgi:hypothetical protein